MNFDIIIIENAYLRFKQLVDNLSYRLQENETTKKDALGKDYKEVTYEIRCNSRVIISNLKDKDDAEILLTRLTDGVIHLLNDEFDTFKASIANSIKH